MKEWLKAAGGKLVYYGLGSSGAQQYYNEKSGGSKLGMVRGYGALNPKEDMSTYMEFIARGDYSKLGKLMASKDWGNRVGKKVQLLKKYKFITQYQLARIQEAHAKEVTRQVLQDQKEILKSLELGKLK